MRNDGSTVRGGVKVEGFREKSACVSGVEVSNLYQKSPVAVPGNARREMSGKGKI
jgi:hypothetical protein